MSRTFSNPQLQKAMEELMLKETIKEATSPKLLNIIAEKCRTEIYNRTKSGKGVTDDQSDKAVETKLEKLSTGYINQRNKKGVTGEFGSPDKSNLTNTGQMLDGIKYEVNDGKIELSISGARTDGKTNEEIAGYVREKRPFFALTLKEQLRVVKEYEKRIRAFLKRGLV